MQAGFFIGVFRRENKPPVLPGKIKKLQRRKSCSDEGANEEKLLKTVLRMVTDSGRYAEKAIEANNRVKKLHGQIMKKVFACVL